MPMSDLLPLEIFKRYQQNEIDIESANKFLKTYIESSDDENLRLEAVELLSKIGLEKDVVFKFLENLVVSDSNKKVRLGAVRILLDKFFPESQRVILHVIAHERSADILYFLYKTLEEMNTDLSRQLISLMEEKLAYKRTRLPLTKYYMEFDLVPREAFALRLLYLETKSGIFDMIHSFDSPCVSVKIENQHVVFLSIFEVKFPEIKFLDLFSELRSLTINFANLKEIKNLESLDKLTSLNLKCNDIRKLEGLDGLINLEDLMIEANPIEEIEGLDNLKKLKVQEDYLGHYHTQ